MSLVRKHRIAFSLASLALRAALPIIPSAGWIVSLVVLIIGFGATIVQWRGIPEPVPADIPH